MKAELHPLYTPGERAVLLSRMRTIIPAADAAAARAFLDFTHSHLGRIYANRACSIHMLFPRGEKLMPRRKLRDYLEEKTDNPDIFPSVPIVELAGSHRMLVENHLGVIQYSTEKIGIKMKYGQLQICGCGLTLEQMTKVKLVVTGRIDGISLLRREGT